MGGVGFKEQHNNGNWTPDEIADRMKAILRIVWAEPFLLMALTLSSREEDKDLL